MSWLNDNFISRFFVTVIGWFYSLTGNYLIAVILFTLAVKLLLLPLDLQQRRAQQAQMGASAKVKEIQNRYKSDPRLAQQKVREFYKKENIKQSAGCLPTLLQLPVLFAMFGAITLLSNIQTINLVTNLANGSNVMPPSAIWVHNIWRPDAGNAAIMPSLNEFDAIVRSMKDRISPDLFAQAQTLLSNSQIDHLALTVAKLPAGTYFAGMVNAAYATIPQSAVTAAVSLNYTSAIAPVVSAFPGLANGLYIFPVLAAAATFLSGWLQKKQNEKANPGQPQAMAGGMEYMMPLVTLWWTATSGVTFAMYWMTNSLLSLASIPLLNKVVGGNSRSTEIAEK